MSPDMQSEPIGDHEDAPPDVAPVHEVVVPARAIGAIGLAVAATWITILVIDRGRTVLALLVGAGAAALVLAPLVRRLERVVPRAAAVVGATLGGIVLTVAVIGVVAWDLDRQADDLSEDIRSAIDALPPGSAAADVADEIDLASTADDLLDGLAAEVVLGDDDPLAVAGRVSKIVLVGVLAAFLVTQGTPLVDRALRSIRRASIREEVHRAMGSARRRGGAHVRRTVAVSVVHGAVAGAVAAVLGMPGAISLAAWVALAVTVPILGGPLAWAPVVAVAWAADVEPVAVTALAVLCIVADRAARARWVRTTVDIGPLLTLIGFGVGFYALGLPGAFVGLIAVAAIGAALDPGVTDVREVVEGLVDQPDAVSPADGTPAPTGPAIVERTSAGPVLRLRLSRRTAIAAGISVVAAVAALRLLDQVQGFVVWLVVGSFIAIGLDRPVAAMHRAWKVPRAGAVALVFALVIGVVAAVGVVAGPSITDSADEIVADAPDAVESLESLPLVGAWLEENEVSERLGDEIAALPDRVRESHVVERVVDAAGDGFIGFLWVLAVILAVLLDGPRLVEVARRRVPVSSRREAVRFGRAAYDALSNLAAASAFVAVANGTVVMLIAVALGVPLAPVLGLWAAWWNVIPQVGGFVGAAPLVALAVGEGPWHGVIALVAFVIYQTIENHVIQPALGGRAVRLPPLVILVGVLIGASLFGFVGAILAGPALGLAKVAFDEVRGAPEPRIEDRPREAPA